MQQVQGVVNGSWSLYLESKVDAIAEMYSLEAGCIWVHPVGDVHTVAIPSESTAEGRLSQSVDGIIGDGTALDQSNALEFREQSETFDRFICQVSAAAKVDIPNSVAALNKALDTFIRDLYAMPKVDIMQVLAEFCDGLDRDISDVAAFRQDQVAKTRCSINNFLHSRIGETGTRCQVKDPEVFERTARRDVQESVVIDQIAASQAQLTKAVTLDKERRDGPVANLVALVQVDLEYVWAVLGKSVYGIVSNLCTFVQF